MAFQTMRGLNVFIADIRACTSKEQQKARVEKELANIRTKFKSSSTLTAYDKKKYVWKILYIYMLGYDVEFGHMEAVGLVSGTKYSEKQVGYLVTSVLLNESNEFLRLVINSMRKDIVSKEQNFQTLALTAVGNLGSKEFAESLAGDVSQLLVSPSSHPSVKKKAALCMLRLYRKNNDIITPESFGDAMGQLLDERDLGILLATLSLLIGLISKNGGYAGYDHCYGKVVRILDRLTSHHEIPNDYTYYGIPIPWLQVKCLEAIGHYPIPEDDPPRRATLEVLGRLLEKNSATGPNINQNNAHHSILFATINLAIKYASASGESGVMQKCLDLLKGFVSYKEANVRYLGLETLSRLSHVPEVLRSTRTHLDAVIDALRDADVSIRRRALDLLYEASDMQNGSAVVEELLAFLPEAEFALREEIALKVAILAERFAPNLSWYVDVTLALVDKAGDFLSDDIWHRSVQVITNHEDLQAYAASKCVELLRGGVAHECAVKVCGYLLGEFGWKLDPAQGGASAKDQFDLLYERFPAASTSAKSLLLSSFMKGLAHEVDAGRSPTSEHGQAVVALLKRYESHTDSELQQRSAEYLALCKRPQAQTSKVLEMMPKFPTKESSLLKRLAEKRGEGDDEDTGTGGVVAPPAVMAAAHAASAPSSSATTAGAVTGGAAADQVADLLGGADLLGEAGGGGGGGAGGGGDLLGGDLLGGGAASSPAAGIPAAAQALISDPLSSKLFLGDSGVLFEDDLIQIGVKLALQRHEVKVALYFGNKSGMDMDGVLCTAEGFPGTSMQTVQYVPSRVEVRRQHQCHIACTVQSASLGPNGETHIGTVMVSYRPVDASGTSRAPMSFSLPFPVYLHKFFMPAPNVSQEQYFGAWRQYSSDTSLTHQKIVHAGKSLTATELNGILSTYKLHACIGYDPNPANAIGCAFAVSASAPQTPVLVRIESDPNNPSVFRVTACSSIGACARAAMQVVSAAMEKAA